MIRSHVLAFLVLAVTLVAGCSTPPSAVDAAATDEEWSCAESEVSGFVTKPVTYPADLSIAEVASAVDKGEAFWIDSQTGRSATVTFLNEQGLITRRLEFQRSESVGWHLDQGQTC